VSEGRACKTCLPAAQFLLKQVRAGKAKKEREDAFHARFDPGKVKTIVTDGSPEMGPPDAPVTIVEWADFECPHCRLFSPLFDDLLHQYPKQLRLVFKYYPLSSHPHGEPAARAAVAAQRQGKFWEMHHMLFDNQDRLEQSDLEKYAKGVGLDLGKFRAEFGSKELAEVLERDKKQADGLGLDGTPFIFINGRLFDLQYVGSQDDLTDWIKLELELSGHAPQPAEKSADAPKPSASAVQPAATSIPAATGTPKK
jgi:protein-disulfide isomerase